MIEHGSATGEGGDRAEGGSVRPIAELHDIPPDPPSTQRNAHEAPDGQGIGQRGGNGVAKALIDQERWDRRDDLSLERVQRPAASASRCAASVFSQGKSALPKCPYALVWR
jgi:hypothetical protein